MHDTEPTHKVRFPMTIRQRARRLYCRVFWVAPALVVSWFAAVRFTSGWGAFGYVWLIMSGVASSAVLGAAGLGLWLEGLRRGEGDPGLLVRAAVSASVVLWASVTR